jgi:hypothetical protein
VFERQVTSHRKCESQKKGTPGSLEKLNRLAKKFPAFENQMLITKFTTACCGTLHKPHESTSHPHII